MELDEVALFLSVSLAAFCPLNKGGGGIAEVGRSAQAVAHVNSKRPSALV
jgi:hypothetical protein